MHANSHRFSYVPGWIDSTSTATPDDDTRRRAAFLRTVPLLAELDDDALWRLARAGRTEQWAPGDTAYAPQADHAPHRCYVICSGAADALIVEASGATDYYAGLTVHDWFGDAGMLTQAPAHAMIVGAGREPLDVVAFDATIVHGVIAEHILVSRLRLAQQPHNASSLLDVRGMRLFSDLPMHDLTAILADAEQQTYVDGASIVRQGDAGDRFYIVLQGDVAVRRDGETIAYLGAGDYFGETALIFNCPRTATVTAIDTATTWSISRASFDALVRHYVIDSRRVKDTIGRRMRTSA